MGRRRTFNYLIDSDDNWFFHNNSSIAYSERLEAGRYEIDRDSHGNLFLLPIEPEVDDIVPLPNPCAERALDLAERFVRGEFRESLDSMGILNKLTMLLWGEPGTSKTITVHQIADLATDHDWVVLYDNDPDDVLDAIEGIREKEPGRGIVVVWEEFDHIVYNHEHEVLQMLDGSDQHENVLFVLTTNYLFRLPDRIFLRCRRVPFQVQFMYPGETERRVYFEHKIPEAFRDRVDIEEWVAKSEGLSIDQCAQLLVAVLAYGRSLEDVLEDVASRKAALEAARAVVSGRGEGSDTDTSGEEGAPNPEPS